MKGPLPFVKSPAASLLLACLFLGTAARAQLLPDNPKVSDDLEGVLVNRPDVTHVYAVISTPSAPSKALTTYLSTVGATVKRKMVNLPMVTVKLPTKHVFECAARTDASYVSYDRDAMKAGRLSLTTGADAAFHLGGPSGYDGTGIGIAVLDSGVYAQHTSMAGASSTTRVVYSQDFTDDPYGHGTHVAATAAGNGAVASGAYEGVAPNAKIINLRVLNSRGTGSTSSIIEAVDWIIANRAAYNIRVVNMSFGTPAVDSYQNDPLCKAARKLVDLGLVVVAAAGNEGRRTRADGAVEKVYGLIHSPGIDPSVITVGASNTFGTDSRHDDQVTTYSCSRGPTRGSRTDAAGVKHYDNLVKPDLAAPGNKIIEAQSPGNLLVSQNPSLGDGTVETATKRLAPSGTLMTDGTIMGDVQAMSKSALIEGDPTGSMACVADVPPPAPNAPGTLAAVALSTSQVQLTWADNSADEVGFRVEPRPTA